MDDPRPPLRLGGVTGPRISTTAQAEFSAPPTSAISNGLQGCCTINSHYGILTNEASFGMI
jgi:hypothetical protein